MAAKMFLLCSERARRSHRNWGILPSTRSPRRPFPIAETRCYHCRRRFLAKPPTYDSLSVADPLTSLPCRQERCMSVCAWPQERAPSGIPSGIFAGVRSTPRSPIAAHRVRLRPFQLLCSTSRAYIRARDYIVPFEDVEVLPHILNRRNWRCSVFSPVLFTTT